MSPEDMTEVVKLAHQRGIWVISDECYVYLNYTGQIVSGGSFTDCKEHVIVLGSLSKTYAMTGWRAGFALGPKAVIAAAKLPFAITHAPGLMLVTDLKNKQLAVL